MKNVIIVGASGHGKVIIDIFEKQNDYQIAGILDDNVEKGSHFFGYTVLGTTMDLPDLVLKYQDCEVFIGIGDNWIRHKVKDKIQNLCPDISFANAIHPSAQLAKGVTLGVGNAIMPGAIINSDCKINNFTIINTKASLDHDSCMKDFSSLAPNATTGGNVTIGEFSVISIGATIKHGISIGDHSVIGAVALLLQNCDDRQVLYGTPAKVIRNRQLGDKYL